MATINPVQPKVSAAFCKSRYQNVLMQLAVDCKEAMDMNGDSEATWQAERMLAKIQQVLKDFP